MTKKYGVALKLTQKSDFEVETDNPDAINVGTLLNTDGGVDWDMQTGYKHPPKYEIEDIWEIKEDDSQTLIRGTE